MEYFAHIYKKLYEDLPIGIEIYDHNGIMININDAECEITI